jgi:hypothetical protein
LEKLANKNVIEYEKRVPLIFSQPQELPSKEFAKDPFLDFQPLCIYDPRKC